MVKNPLVEILRGVPLLVSFFEKNKKIHFLNKPYSYFERKRNIVLIVSRAILLSKVIVK
jgi:hypothetical protein